MGLDGVERKYYFQDKEPERIKGRSVKKTTLFFLLAFFFLAAFFLYLFFNNKIFEKEKSIRLEIKVFEDVVVGQDFNLRISILNQENLDIINSEVFIGFPEEFQYLSSEPNCSEILLTGCLIKTSGLKKNEQKEIVLNGKFFDLTDKKKTFVARVTFQLEGLSSWFKKEITREIILNRPPLDLEFIGSEELLGTEDGEFRIKIKNLGSRPLTGRLVLFSADDFNFINLSLMAIEEEGKEEQKIWDIDLGRNEEKIIDFSGYFSESDQEEERKFILQMGFLGLDNEFFVLEEKQKILKIVQPGLVVGFKINDSFSENISQNFDETISASLSYKNIDQEKIFEPIFKLKIEEPFLVDLLKNEDWKWQQGEKKIELDKWQIEEKKDEKLIIFSSPMITEINPGEEGEIKVFFKIAAYEKIALLKQTNLRTNLSAEIEGRIFRNQTLIFKNSSNIINLKINSWVKLDVEARYFSDQGVQIGSGPLPPKVNEKTNYFVFLRPINTINEIENIKIIANLTEKINWAQESRSSIGNLFYNQDKKQVIWQIDSLPTHSGGSYSFIEASFKISLIPEQEDRYQVLNLLEKISLEAKDSFSNGQIYIETEPITTNLKFDDRAKGKGIVE